MRIFTRPSNQRRDAPAELKLRSASQIPNQSHITTERRRKLRKQDGRPKCGERPSVLEAVRERGLRVDRHFLLRGCRAAGGARVGRAVRESGQLDGLKKEHRRNRSLRISYLGFCSKNVLLLSSVCK